MVGIAAFMGGTADRDTRTLIEATAAGWWYSTPLPDHGQVAVFMTDADEVKNAQADLAAYLREQLRDAPLTRNRTGGISVGARIAVFPAMTYAYPQVHGANWLLAGDAASTWDPLSGQGICKALESGLKAARAIDLVLAGDDCELEEYSQWTHAQFDGYLRTRAKYYAAEQRWPDAPFWRRRHSAN
jgi:flavin-dependent dehydrogenase